MLFRSYKNLYVKSNLSGEFVVLNPYLVKDLKARGLWNQDMIDSLKYFDGELKDIDGVPDDLKVKYLTAFDVDHKWIIDAAARRQKWIDQSQSVNLWLKTPDLKTLSHMYRHAWHAGLKTTYYLRTLGASNIEKATVSVKKEVRGAVKEGQDGGQNSGDMGGSHSVQALSDQAATARFDTTPGLPVVTDLSSTALAMEGAKHFDTPPPIPVPSPIASDPSSAATVPSEASREGGKRPFTAAEKTTCSIEAMRNGGECEACQ